jgi:hypothetical protein
MPPEPRDLHLAGVLAARIAAVGEGRVRRVGIIGSRAAGTATAASDLDLVVLIETPGTIRWTPAQILAEKRRLTGEAGPPPLPTDLWVRTTDQFAEAHHVRGCVEHLLDSEGVDVYTCPERRAPVLQRTPAQVRGQNVQDWIEGSAVELERAVALERGLPIPPQPGPFSRDPGHYAWRSIQRSLVALCVLHQTAVPRKDQPPETTLAMLDRPEPSASQATRVVLARDGHRSTAAAREVLSIVRRRLQPDPSFAPPAQISRDVL